MVTNLSQDAVGRWRWRDTGAVGMVEDAARKLSLFIHGNVTAEPRASFGIKTFKIFLYLGFFFHPSPFFF